MNIFRELFKLRISSKLLWFNIFISLLLVVVLIASFFFFRHVQVLLSRTVEDGLQQLTTNARISRGLSTIFADTNLLLNTFYERQEYLRDSGRSLVEQAEALFRESEEPKIRQSLSGLIKTLQLIVQRGGQVNHDLEARRELDTRLQQLLNRLEAEITYKIIDRVFRGEDAVSLEQSAALVAGFRESFLEIGKTHAELWPDHYLLSLKDPGDPLLEQLDSLSLRLQTMTAADPQIAGLAQDILGTVAAYRALIVELHRKMKALKEERQLFERNKHEIISAMERIDQEVAQLTIGVRNEITARFSEIIGASATIGLVLILILGLITYSFFRTILKVPMQQMHDGIRRFSRGELNARISLGREDEWSVIETALNKMAEDLAASYAEREDKIRELEENVTARRQAEEAVRWSEEKYRSIFENALEGIFQISEEGRMISANPAMARIFGYASAHEMVQTISDAASQLYADPPVRHYLLRQLQSRGTITDFEARFKKKDGRLIWGLVNSRYIKGGPELSPYIEGSFQDITYRKQAEEEKAVLEEQLRQSQKMEAIGSLAGGISHDFNNLLHAISGNLELLLLKISEEAPEYKHLKEIEKAVARAIDIARRLLTFSRKIETKNILLDLNEVIENTLRILKHTLPKMIAVTTDLHPGLPPVKADSTQLDQVLMNLAANAADAMPGGGRLMIETKIVEHDDCKQINDPELTPGRYVLLQVSDTGEGIERETLEHIFEPFFTTKPVGKGTGLGLSIVYGIVKNFNGQLTCHSDPGAGTVFRIFLPAADPQDLDTCRDTAPAKTTASSSNSESVLVVDDEEMVRTIADEILSTFGYTVIKAASGEEALRLFQQGQSFDLVLLDLGMPGMGGERCLKELRRIDPSIKVIVASGYATHDIAINPEQYGARGFIAKPYRLKEMVAVVRRVLDHN